MGLLPRCCPLVSGGRLQSSPVGAHVQTRAIRHCVTAGSKGGRQQRQKKKRDAGTKGSNRQSSQGPKVQGVTLPESREAAVLQGSAGLRALYVDANSRKPRGMMDSGEEVNRKTNLIQIDIPVEGQVEDSLQVGLEILSKSSLNQANDLCYFVLPNGSVHSSSSLMDNSLIVAMSEAKNNVQGAKVVVFICPSASDLPTIQDISLDESIISQNTMIVLLNPEWAPRAGDADGGVGFQYTDFVQSFTPAYCFFPILIKPFMMQQIEGVVYTLYDSHTTSVKESIFKPWKIFIRDETTNEYELVGQMRTRPSSSDVETILYNAIAAKNNKGANKGASMLKNFFGNTS
jgi:hypothetical protein